MNYAYKKDNFTLQELMKEFNISKSTALRYISSLEDIGVPIYSEMGRYGGYKILDTYKIPPITFTPEETYALFFSMKSMELYASLPFQAEYSMIEEKFLSSVSPKIKSSLEQIKSRISFNTIKIANDCPLLGDILQAIVKPTILRIVYESSGHQSNRKIQPIGILAEHGIWYCPSFDIDKNEYRLFRCDRILKIEILEDQPLEHVMKYDLNNRIQLVKKSSKTIDYKIQISRDGISIYERNHFPNMTLEEDNGQIIITGWIEPSEMEFLLTYLHQFGQYIVNIYPHSIKEQFVKQLEIILYNMNYIMKQGE